MKSRIPVTLWLLLSGCGASQAPTAEQAAALNATTLASNQQAPGEIHVHNGAPFWSAGDGIWTYQGGAPIRLAADPQVNRFAVDDSFVYWVHPAAKDLWRVPVGGGASAQVATLPVSYARAIALDGTSIYVAGIAAGTAGESLYRLPIAGGSPALIATDPGAVDDLAVDGTSLYFNSLGTVGHDGVYKVDKTGGTPVLLGAYLVKGTLQLDGGYLYFSTGSSVGRVGIDGTGAVSVAFDQNMGTFSVGGGWVYYTAGGWIKAELLPYQYYAYVAWDPAHQYSPAGVAVSGGQLYWTSRNSTGSGLVQVASATDFCTPQNACTGNFCGQTSACGGVPVDCSCRSGTTCQSNGSCCQPITSCPANSCGNVSDGCGGTLWCGPCVCHPSCAGKKCGATDGCGGSCPGYCTSKKFTCQLDTDSNHWLCQYPSSN